MIMLTLTVVIIVGWFTATLLSGDRPALGLDLQGGVSVVLQPVKGSDLSTLDTAAQIIRNRVDGLGIAEPDVSRQGNNIVVDLPGAKNQQQALDLVGRTAELRFRPVEVNPQTNQPVIFPYSVDSSATTTTTTTGGTGSTTTAPKGATTTIQPATSTTKGKALGGKHLDLQPIAATRPAADPTTVPSTTPATTVPKTGTTVKGATTPTSAAPAVNSSAPCQGQMTPPEKNIASQPVILPDLKKQYCYGLGPTLLTGKNISGADATIDPSTAAWIVQVDFKNDDFVTKVANPNVGKQVAITLDQEVVSAPTINPNITGTKVQITGQFSEKEAHNLALSLRYGSLPVVFKTATSQTVSPTLGKDQLHAGIVAGLIGLALVAIYMIVFYRLLGVVVWIGLALTGMTFFSLTTWLSVHQGLTLTLAGVTGIIVSVGVTVDSYVVYFERLKDEVRTGKTVRSSLDPGFRRAFRTIIAADLVSLLGAVVLYLLATGSVRGFAYFLGLSTLLDLILAYTFMHPFVVLLARRPRLIRMPGIGIAAGLDTPEVKA
jgi:preprotein translocase subunit SecD